MKYLNWLTTIVLAGPISATSIPSVQVQLQILDPIYRREFGSRIDDAEKALAAPLIEELRHRIGFLRFSTAAQPYRLVIQLGDPNAPAIRDVAFNLKLSLPGGSAANQFVSWRFRALDNSFLPLSTQQTPVEKIKDVNLVGTGAQPGELQRQFAAGDFDRLVANLLSLIPIAADGSLQMDPSPKWLLPLHRGEVCLDLPSRFNVKHVLREANSAEEVRLEVEASGPPDGVTDALVTPIVARVPDVPPQATKIARLRDPSVNEIQITGVFITQYNRRSLCGGDAVPIDPASLSGGGLQ